MAKKVRRVRRKARVKKKDEEAATPSEEHLREEYAYVLRDLRLMFILAAVMFALLILLNIVI